MSIRLNTLACACLSAAAILSGPTTATATPAMAADFNNDHAVDHLDLLKWCEGYGGTALGNELSGGSGFLAWQRQLGQTSPANGVSELPEPATMLLWTGLAGLAYAAKRHVN